MATPPPAACQHLRERKTPESFPNYGTYVIHVRYSAGIANVCSRLRVCVCAQRYDLWTAQSSNPEYPATAPLSGAFQFRPSL